MWDGYASKGWSTPCAMDVDAARRLALEMLPGQDAVVDFAIEILQSQQHWGGEPEALLSQCLEIIDNGTLAETMPPMGLEEGMKMVLLVQTSLSMSPGKVASQCVHAALGASRSSKALDMERWTTTGEKAVCLNVETEEEMNELVGKAQSASLNVHSCLDAGRTQVSEGSRTVVAIGPHTESDIDAVTGHLKLY